MTSDYSDIELEILIESLYLRYHWSFKNYKRASLKRRIQQYCRKCKLDTIAELIPIVIHDENFASGLLHEISVPVTEMFRDPSVFRYIKNHIFPILKTYPYINIWHPGCASGEEVYSLAIMLEEDNSYERTHIIGTDINQHALRQAQEGIYRTNDIQNYSDNYFKAGGTNKLLNYFDLSRENAVIKNNLKKNISFSYHNLAEDIHLSQINLILCRNVFIYFDQELQDHVIKLFYDSLYPGGFLILGSKETLNFSAHKELFDDYNYDLRIYRKRYR